MLNETSTADRMIDTFLPVTESQGPGTAREAYATRVGPTGMEMNLLGSPTSRYSWVEFSLPTNGYRIKALGEVVAVSGSGEGKTRVQLRFKHLFPQDRREMDGFLNAREAA